MRHPRAIGRSVLPWLTLVALVAGFVAGRSSSTEQVDAAAEPPGTPATDCAPAATPTLLVSPTPTPVPPVAAGEPLPYPGDWLVTITGASTQPTIGEVTADATFVIVRFTLTNNAATPRTFPFRDFVLVDPEGRVFLLAEFATSQLSGAKWYLHIPPSLPAEIAVAFEVTPADLTTFILESKVDPAFRVRLDLGVRG